MKKILLLVLMFSFVAFSSDTWLTGGYIIKTGMRMYEVKEKCGDPFLKEKIGVNSQVWIGRTLFPRLMIYSFFFLGALGGEIGIIVLSFIYSEITIRLPFLSLTALTIIAMLLFFIEGFLIRQKAKKNLT